MLKADQKYAYFRLLQQYVLGPSPWVVVPMGCSLFFVPSSKNKLETLTQISIKLDLIKILLRIGKDTQAVKNNKYLELQTTLQEIGRMLGGWIRSSKQSLVQDKLF